MISVCIASYNGEKYIKRQVVSILNQLDQNDEVIIADDGSQDNTIHIIKELKDKRIRIIDGAHRHSPIWNFEKALSASKGDYIYLSDQDDEWMPNKIKIMQHYFQTYDCVISDNITLDGNHKIISSSFFKLNNTKGGKYYNLLIKNGYLGCCMAFNRKVLNASLPFPSNIPMHDIWIGNVAAFHFRLKFIPDKLIYFYRHGDNVSSTAGKSRSSIWKKISYRWNIIKGLLLL